MPQTRRPFHDSSSYPLTGKVRYCNDGRKRILPININISHRHEEGSAEIEYCFGRRSHSRSTTLLKRLYCCHHIAPQIAHPPAYTIIFHHIDLIPARPLVEQVGEVNPCIYSILNR